jgi:hypothetical protein
MKTVEDLGTWIPRFGGIALIRDASTGNRDDHSFMHNRNGRFTHPWLSIAAVRYGRQTN